MATQVQEGDILAGKYRVERVLASGGMGVVVAAIHQQLEKRVALKFLLPEGMNDSSMVGRFLREAKAAVRLRSEHVARVLDVGTAESGSPYIVMEYLEGTDLSDLLDKEGKLPIAVAASYVLQAFEAVAEAHALGIVHRDLKPANLFLTRAADGQPCVKVLDFGISKVSTDSEQNLTGTMTVMGTPRYMAPEQLRSSKNVDHRSDIWSLGMILYELVTGVVAFQRDTLPELCTAILFEPVPRPRDLAPTLPEELDATILRALEKHPADRFQNLSEFAWALAPMTAGGEALASRVSRVLGVEPAAAPQGMGVAETEPPPPSELGPKGPATTAMPAVVRKRTAAASTDAHSQEVSDSVPMRRPPWRSALVALALAALAATFLVTRAHSRTLIAPEPPAQATAPAPSLAPSPATQPTPEVVTLPPPAVEGTVIPSAVRPPPARSATPRTPPTASKSGGFDLNESRK